MAVINSALKKLFYSADKRRREFAVRAANFALENPQALLIMCDPDTDLITVLHGKDYVAIRIKDPTNGKRPNVVGNAMHYLNNRTNKALDQFLLAVDSAMFNLAQARYNRRKQGLRGKVLKYTGIGARPDLERSGSTVAPFQVVDEEKEAK